jgi:hypothetical protein
MKRAVAFLASTLCYAQGPCFPPFSGTIYPSLAQYLTGLQTSMQNVRNQIAGLPQPRVQMSGQQVWAVGGFFTEGRPCTPGYPGGPAGTCPYDTYPVQRNAMRYLAESGVVSVDWNIGLLPLKDSAEYQTAWAAMHAANSWPSVSLLVPDCSSPGNRAVNLSYSPGSATVVPAGAKFWCQSLAVMDDIVNQAIVRHLKIRLAPTPGPPSEEQSASECNLTAGSPMIGGPLPSVTECYGPLYYAAVLRWGQALISPANPVLDSFTLIHEPTGIWGQTLVVPLTLANVEQFIQFMYPTVKTAAAAAGISLAVGSAVTTSNSESAGYWSDWISNLFPATACTSGSTTCFDFAAVDVYPNSWDAASYGAPSGQFLCGAVESGSPTCPLTSNVLDACTPAWNDTNQDCQWMVASSLSAPAGAVLGPATTYTAGGSFAGAGTCVYEPLEAGHSAGMRIQLTVAGGVVTGTKVLNGGQTVSVLPSGASKISGAACSGSIGLNSVAGNFANSGGLSYGAYLGAQALAAGKPVRVNESNRPTYVLVNCGPSSSRGIFDSDYIEWLNDGADSLWFSVMPRWAAANGFSSWSPYFTTAWSYYNPVNINAIPPCVGPSGSDNCPNGALYSAPNIGPLNQSGQTNLTTGDWSTASIQGHAHVSGAAQVH